MSASAGDAAPMLFDVVGEHVALLRLNRPGARNAIDAATAQAIATAVQRTEDDPRFRVAVIASSSPGIFSAGADLKEVAAGRAGGLVIGKAGFAGLVDTVRAKPWIAAVDGPALGGGCELCLACDMIVASPVAWFGLPEVKLGLLAGGGGVHRLARVLPRNVALGLVATGAPIDGRAAARYGMVNRLVASERVLEEALALALQVAANAPLAVAESLRLARAAAESSDAGLRLGSRVALARLMASEDGREGPRAFVERRSPVWRGR